MEVIEIFLSLATCIVMSIVSTLSAMLWIMGFQVVIATRNSRLLQMGEGRKHQYCALLIEQTTRKQISSDIGRGFPYVLAGHYLSAGVGAVLGVLSAAFATTLLRERRAAAAAAASAAYTYDSGSGVELAHNGESRTSVAIRAPVTDDPL